MLTKERLVFRPFEYEQAHKYWLLQQQAHWLHCVAGNQRVVTSKGLLTAQELYDLGEPLLLFDGQRVVESSPMLKTAHRKVYKIHTKEGYTHTVTADHRVMTSKGWVEAHDLKPGDLLCLQREEGLFGTIHNPQKAFLLGHFQGDGTLNKTGKSVIWTVWEKGGSYKHTKELESCMAAVYQQENLSTDRYPVPTFGTEVNASRRMLSMRLWGPDFEKNKIPDFIWQGDRETVAAYIRGLFLTDGTAYQGKKHESIKLAQIDLDYLANIQTILLNFGIKSSIYLRPARNTLMPDGNGGEKLYACKEIGTLEVTQGSSVAILNDITGIFEDRGKTYRGLQFPNKSNPIIHARFTSLEPLQDEDVFCVSVYTDEHAWVCNGFITHNTEISMASDINDFKENLTPAEVNVIENVLKLFTQTEVVVNDYWGTKVTKWFPKPEIAMMAATFASFETIHQNSYAYLNDSLGIDNYASFLEEPSMKDKISSLIEVPGKTKREIALSLAVFSAFAEGVSLFSSFAILMNYSRRNLMKGVGQIIAMSVRDESLHSNAGCWLFRTFIKENPQIMDDDFKTSIYQAARDCVAMEDKYIDKVFEMGPIEGLDPADLKEFIRHRANVKLGQLGFKMNWKNIDKEKVARLAWFDLLSSGVEHQDFFAQRSTSYSKTTEDFSSIWDD